MGHDVSLPAHGIVLNTTAFAETDKLVTLYCQDLGRITAIAKGAFKSKKRFVNKLEPWSQLLFFYQNPRNDNGLFFLREAELLDARIHIRQDYRRYVAAAYFSELLLLLTREQDPDEPLYTLLRGVLDILNQSQQPLRVIPLAILNLLCILGYQPQLTNCSRCHQPIAPQRRYFFLPGGGCLLCSNCHPQTTPAPRLSLQTIRILLSALNLQQSRLHRLHLSHQNLVEATEALHSYTLHLVQRDIHAYASFRQLLTMTSDSVAPQNKAIAT